MTAKQHEQKAVLRLLIACACLVGSYRKAERSGSVDWNDIDESVRLARKALRYYNRKIKP